MRNFHNTLTPKTYRTLSWHQSAVLSHWVRRQNAVNWTPHLGLSFSVTVFISVKFESIGEKMKWSIHSTQTQVCWIHKTGAFINTARWLLLRCMSVHWCCHLTPCSESELSSTVTKAAEFVILCAFVLGIFQIIIFYVTSIFYITLDKDCFIVSYTVLIFSYIRRFFSVLFPKVNCCILVFWYRSPVVARSKAWTVFARSDASRSQ
jgi:hypothetical protein